MASQNHSQGPGLSTCPSSAPSLLLPAFPGAALLVTSADTPGSKLIIKLKREGPIMGGAEDVPQTQTFFLTGMPLSWATQRRDGPGGPGVRTVLLTKAGEDPGGRKPRAPPEAAPSAQGSPPNDTSFACTSKGVYENYRRWQRYKALARRHFPATPDAEALACFFIPVLRSLARLRPDMTLEDGVPRAVQEWEHSSNFERMIFYEMAEKFMEFEAEEEQQIQKMKLLASCSQFQTPVPKPAKLPMSPAPDSGQHQVYIPKKSASKSRQPRRRQRRPPSTPNPGAPKEIPAEAVHQYAEIMEGLDTSWEEEEDEKKEQGMGQDPQDQEEAVFPDPALLQYIDQLCDDEEFVCKVEAVIHPQFVADLLSPEKSQDPLDLVDELAEELTLTPKQLTEKRLLALSEEEREPSVYPTSHSDSTPSQSEEEDEVSSNGKGEDTVRQAVKRSSVVKGARTSQPEPATSIVSPPAPHTQQKLGDRESLPNETTARSSPHECGCHNSQDGHFLSLLKNPEEGEMQKSQVKDLLTNHANGPPTQAQRAFPNGKGNNTLTSHLAPPRASTVGKGIPTFCSLGHSKQENIQGGKAKDQGEAPKTTEQSSNVVPTALQSRTQLIWSNLKSGHSNCGKQNGTAKGELRTTGSAQDTSSKGTSHNKQDLKIMFLGNPGVERTLKWTFNRPGGQNEQFADHLQVQNSSGFEGCLSKAELESQGRETRSCWDSQAKASRQDGIQHECGNQDGRQGETAQSQYRSQAHLAPNVSAAQFENVNPGGRRQERKNPVFSGAGTKPVGHEAKAKFQKKNQVEGKQMKNKSPVRGVKLPEDTLVIYPQSSSTRQESQQSTDQSMLEINQETNQKSNMECSRSDQQLTSGDSSKGEEIENQLPDTDSKQPHFFTFSAQKSPSLMVQNGLEKLQESRWPLPDQSKAVPQMENLSNDKCPKPTLNPSNYNIVAEAHGSTCGPHGDHIPVATSLPHPSRQGCDSHENIEPTATTLIPEPRDSLPPQICWGPVRSEDEMRICNQVGRDLLDEGITMNVLPEIPGRTMEGILKEEEEEEGEEEEEDEELSSFSSLLASKLSLSPYSDHCTMEQGDTLPFSLTDPARPDKGRRCSRGQVHQNSTSLPNKNLEVNPSAHRSHKRKSNTVVTRRSKRLRNQ